MSNPRSLCTFLTQWTIRDTYSFPSPQPQHMRPHTSFRCCQIPQTRRSRSSFGEMGWALLLCCKILLESQLRDPKPPQLEAPLRFSSPPRGTLAREQRVTFQQEMLILDWSATHAFLINSQTKMNHHLCFWGNRGAKRPKSTAGNLSSWTVNPLLPCLGVRKHVQLRN